MNLKVRLFASVREALGREQIEVTLPDDSTLADLLTAAEEQYPQFARISSALYAAVNGKYARDNLPLHETDEIVLFPPVSGGQPPVDERFQITREPLSLDDVAQRLNQPEMGAITLFAGIVRGVTEGKETDYLEYEVYRPMAEATLAQIAGEAQERWPDIGDIAIIHRVGKLAVGETSIIIAVAASHRLQTFAACHYIIDRVKEITPIWKKEVRPDGADWVELHDHRGFGNWDEMDRPTPLRGDTFP